MTNEELKAYSINNNPMVPTFSGPFGVSDNAREYPRQFTTAYSTPVSNGGLKLTRHLMNGLGYYATIGTFLDSVGYRYGWNQNNASFGGYPKGAIVSILEDNYLYEFLNIVDNNTQKPILPTSGTLTEDVLEENGWKLINSIRNHNFFPNYESRTLINEFIVTSKLDRTLSLSSEGWILIERTLENWEDLTVPEILGYAPAYPSRLWYAANEAWNEQNVSETDVINQFEGKVASRFLPCSGTVNLRAEIGNPVTSMTVRLYFYEMEG